MDREEKTQQNSIVGIIIFHYNATLVAVIMENY